MSISNNMQVFLKKQLKERHLKRKDFIEESGIPASTVAKIIKADHSHSELKTVIKVADYFNCGIDEVTGRDDFIPAEKVSFNKATLDEAKNSIKEFIKHKLKETNLSVYQLGRKCGFSEHVFVEFMKEDSITKTLGTSVTVALADYFKVSLDEMLGRSPSTNKLQEITKVLSPSDLTPDISSSKIPAATSPALTPIPSQVPDVLKGMNAADLESMKNIMGSLAANKKKQATKNPSDTKDNPLPPKPKEPSRAR